jgi:hypothetical protein
VRIRNVQTGQLIGTTTSNGEGQFTFTDLSPAQYVIEVVDPSGTVIGTSPAVAAVAGAAVGMIVQASAAAAGGGGSFFGSSLGFVTIAAVGAGFAGVTVAIHKSNASPSR